MLDVPEPRGRDVSTFLWILLSVLYLALDAMGVWGEVNKSLSDLVNASGGTESATTSTFRITAWGVIGTSTPPVTQRRRASCR